MKAKRKIQSLSVRSSVMVRPGNKEEVRVGTNNSGGALGRRLHSGAFMHLCRGASYCGLRRLWRECGEGELVNGHRLLR